MTMSLNMTFFYLEVVPYQFLSHPGVPSEDFPLRLPTNQPTDQQTTPVLEVLSDLKKGEFVFDYFKLKRSVLLLGFGDFRRALELDKFSPREIINIMLNGRRSLLLHQPLSG